MKMKKILLLVFIGAVIASAMLVGCQKAVNNLINNVDSTNSATVKVQAVDVSSVNSESDLATNDVDIAVTTNAKMGGTGTAIPNNGLPTDVGIDSSAQGLSITINYNGNINGCRTRTGKIVVQLVEGSRWRDVGAVLKLTFDSVRIHNSCTKKTIILMGVKYITNLSGGNLFTLVLAQPDTLIHKVRANYRVTFIDSVGNMDSAKWNVARNTKIAYSSALIFVTTGDTTINGISNVESYGTTRGGSSFTTAFTTPVISNTTCGLGFPIAGAVAHVVGIFPFAVQYGVDANGNQVLPPTCASYYKVSWVSIVTNATVSVVLPY